MIGAGLEPFGMPPLVAASSPEVFWFVCLFVVVYQTWRGWRTGVARQLASVAGLVAGWLIGLTQGPAFVARHLAGSGWPTSVMTPIASVTIGLIVYVIAVVAGCLLFKRACDHSFGPTRLMLGAGGAAVGFGVGVFSVWVMIIAILLTAALLDPPDDAPAAVPPASRSTPAPSPAPSTVIPNGNKAAPVPAVRPGPAKPAPLRPRGSSPHAGMVAGDADTVVTPLGQIRDSINAGLLGEVIRFTDPLPAVVYTNLNKISVIAGNPRLQERLLDVPELHDVATNPKVIALRQDPAVLDAWQRRDFSALARNPRLLSVMNDPALAKRLQKVDITRVLNEAAAEPGD